MGKFYHYTINNEVFGPFTLDEIRGKRLYRDTLFSFEGSEGWVLASSVEELSKVTLEKPPALPSKIDDSPPPKSIKKYDESYEKETDATALGIGLIILKVGLFLFFQYNEELASIKVQRLSYIIGSVITIAVVVMVSRIAKRQNRDAITWGIFALFLPSLALIIIGQLKKLNTIIDVDAISATQILVLTNDCERFANERNYEECYKLSSQLIESNHAFPKVFRLHGISAYFVNDYTSAKHSFEKILLDEEHGRIAHLMLGNVFFAVKEPNKAKEYWEKAKQMGELRAKENLEKYFSDNSQEEG
ncbi:MAG: DUF4339 domain-containing protein [bacterium]|nr:DUF4339 domain-containing protein [bacterium]